MPASSPQSGQTDLVKLALLVNGTDVSGSYEVLSIEVYKAVNRVSRARITLRDGSVAGGDFTAREADDFAPGTALEIKAGYLSEDDSIFSGIIVKHGLRQGAAGPSRLVIECWDKAIRMTVGRKNAYYTQQSDSDILTAIIGTYSLSSTVSATSPVLPGVTQFYCTDWDFVIMRAQVNGFIVVSDAGALTIGAPDLSKEAALSVTYGSDVMEFELEEDASTQFAALECACWDLKTQSMLTAEASPANLNALGCDTSGTLAEVIGAGTVKLNTTGPVGSDQLQSWARAAMLKAELAKICGRIKFQGSASLRVGGMLEVQGFGKRFDGRAFVSGLTHRISGGQWTTEAVVGLNPGWFASEPGIAADANSGLLAPARGLQNGVVKQIQADADGEFRVLVTVPVVGASGDGVWARLATFYATSGAGNFFYPEVGDEVILGFLNEDPRYPIIIGSVYSQTKAAAYTQDAENSTKALTTKGGLKVIFDDKNGVLTIQTPKSNQVIFSDKDGAITLSDENGNSIKLSSEGIALTSARDVSVSAAQNVSIEAKAGKLTAKGAQGVTVSGLSVALSAETEFTATGQASATLSASGQTVIKGAMVMIN